MDDATLRVEARFKNARLFNAIAEHTVAITTDARRLALSRHGPVATFCKIYNFTKAEQQHIYKLLNLKMHPIRHVGKLGTPRVQPLCERLAAVLEREVAWLFPADLYAITWPSIAVEIPHTRMRSLAAAPIAKLLLPPTQDETIAQHELRTRMADALKTLTPREENIIRARFGLGAPTDLDVESPMHALHDGDEHSCEDIAEVLGISRARVFQIEAKAMRKMRHPSRSRPLKAFLYPDYVPPRDPTPTRDRPAPAPPTPESRDRWLVDTDAPWQSWECRCFLSPDHLARDWETSVRIHAANDGHFWNHRIERVLVPSVRPSDAPPTTQHLICLIVQGRCQPVSYRRETVYNT